jgi:hypothetical protein
MFIKTRWRQQRFFLFSSFFFMLSIFFSCLLFFKLKFNNKAVVFYPFVFDTDKDIFLNISTNNSENITYVISYGAMLIFSTNIFLFILIIMYLVNLFYLNPTNNLFFWKMLKFKESNLVFAHVIVNLFYFVSICVLLAILSSSLMLALNYVYISHYGMNVFLEQSYDIPNAMNKSEFLWYHFLMNFKVVFYINLIILVFAFPYVIWSLFVPSVFGFYFTLGLFGPLYVLSKNTYNYITKDKMFKIDDVNFDVILAIGNLRNIIFENKNSPKEILSYCFKVFYNESNVLYLIVVFLSSFLLCKISAIALRRTYGQTNNITNASSTF